MDAPSFFEKKAYRLYVENENNSAHLKKEWVSYCHLYLNFET